MRQQLLFALIAAAIVGGALVYERAFPPPPKDYRIVYFGAYDCGACTHWKGTALRDWRTSEASRHIRLHKYDARSFRNLRPSSFPQESEVWAEVSRKTNGVPAFALVDKADESVVGVYTGIGGWKRLERRVTASFERQKNRLQPADDHAAS